MAVRFADTEHGGASERIISSGGNIYSLASGYMKTGLATRGRGFWVGRKGEDEENPSVDDFTEYQRPYEDTKELLVPEDPEHDGFDDDEDIYTVFSKRTGNMETTIKPQLKQARQLMEAAMGSNLGKSVLTLGSVKVDLLMRDPSDLTEADLLKSTEVIKQLLPSATVREQELLMAHAGKVAAALKSILSAKGVLAKAIFTADRTQKMEAAQAPQNPAKMPPAKAQTTQVNTKGKVAYKYPKNGDGKGPNSDRAEPNTDITPTDAVDVGQFAQVLGVVPQQLQKLATKKTKAEFVVYFDSHEEFLKKHKINRAYIGKLYDALVSQSAPADKSFIVFSPSMLNKPLVKSVISAGVQSWDDFRKLMKARFSCNDAIAESITRRLLNKWERKGVISYGKD